MYERIKGKILRLVAPLRGDIPTGPATTDKDMQQCAVNQDGDGYTADDIGRVMCGDNDARADNNPREQKKRPAPAWRDHADGQSQRHNRGAVSRRKGPPFGVEGEGRELVVYILRQQGRAGPSDQNFDGVGQ